MPALGICISTLPGNDVTKVGRTFDKSNENMRVVTNRYRNGMSTVADVLAAQTLWKKASADLVTAKAALRLAYTDYRRTLGETL
jgi:outer membrane protein TolC